MKKFSHTILAIPLAAILSLAGCSDAGALTSETDPSASYISESQASSPFSYTQKIELKQNEKATYSSYIKSVIKADVTANPDTIDTSKAGSYTVPVTISDSNGNLALVEFEVTVKAEEKKEEPKEEKKEEEKTETKEPETPQQPAVQPTQPVTPVQPSPAPAPVPAPSPAPTPAPSPAPAPSEIEDVGPVAGTQGDPAGSAYDTQEGCNAGAGLASHTCTWDPLSKKYILTY